MRIRNAIVANEDETIEQAIRKNQRAVGEKRIVHSFFILFESYGEPSRSGGNGSVAL